MRKFNPMPQSIKIPDAKAAVDKEWEKLEKLRAWQLTKVKSKKEVFFWKHKRANNSPFCNADGHPIISKMQSWNRSTKSTKARLCSEVTL